MSKLFGIDIGGTKVRAVVFNGSKVLWARETPTPKNEKMFSAVVSGLMKKASGFKINKIGIAVAGRVSGSKIISCANILFLKNFDFKKITPGGARIIVDNDARCMALAEHKLGAGKKYLNIFALALGTGIGRAYSINKKVLRIKEFETSEPWEKVYQRVRDRGSSAVLAAFLAKKLFFHAIKYNPGALVVGGGVLLRKNFFALFKNEFKKIGFAAPIVRSRFQKNSAAIGAAILLKKGNY